MGEIDGGRRTEGAIVNLVLVVGREHEPVDRDTLGLVNPDPIGRDLEAMRERDSSERCASQHRT